MRAEKGITLIISNEDLDEILRILKSLGIFGVFIDGVSGTVNNEKRKQEGEFLGMLLGTL